MALCCKSFPRDALCERRSSASSCWASLKASRATTLQVLTTLSGRVFARVCWPSERHEAFACSWTPATAPSFDGALAGIYNAEKKTADKGAQGGMHSVCI